MQPGQMSLTIVQLLLKYFRVVFGAFVDASAASITVAGSGSGRPSRRHFDSRAQPSPGLLCALRLRLASCYRSGRRQPPFSQQSSPQSFPDETPSAERKAATLLPRPPRQMSAAGTSFSSKDASVFTRTFPFAHSSPPRRTSRSAFTVWARCGRSSAKKENTRPATSSDQITASQHRRFARTPLVRGGGDGTSCCAHLQDPFHLLRLQDKVHFPPLRPQARLRHTRDVKIQQ